MLPQWMYVAAKLEIPERLAQAPCSAKTLGDDMAISPDRMGRLLYALEQRGYFQRTLRDPASPLNGPWKNTAASATLMADHPNTIRPLLIHWMEDCYRPTGHLLESMRQETCAFSLEAAPNHRSFFGDFLPAHPARAALFSEAMTASSAFSDEAVLRDYNWSRFRRLVDVGGARGSFLDLALRRHPNTQGVIFDLPNVIEDARTVWSNRHDSVARRIEFAAGDFFARDSIPALGNGEAFVLRNILHDWPDADCRRILSNLRQAMDSGATLLLVELGLATEASGHALEQARSGIDMLMMTMFEGRERTRPEFEALFAQSGFSLVSMTKTRSVAQVVEAKPIV